MVKIVKKAEQAGDSLVFQFSVYRSPRNHERIMGYLVPFSVQTSERTVTWYKTDFGVPVEQAFKKVYALAEECHIPFLWVNDPKRLFPRSKRPDLN